SRSARRSAPRDEAVVRSISRLHAAVWNLFRRSAVERQLSEELETYVELLTAEKVAQGMRPDDARRAALVDAGGVEQTKEAVRDARAGAWLEAWSRDVRHTLRDLARAPGFTIAVVSTLAIGIGLNSAVFTLVYAALERPLPVRDAARVVNVYQRLRSGGPNGREVRGASWLVSLDEFRSYAQAPALSSAAAYHAQDVTMSGVDHVVPAELVTCGYFRTLEVPVVLGRGFTDDECAHAGTGPVVVLSHTAWQATYIGDSSVVGRVIHLNGLAMTIIGVAAPDFGGISYQ